MIRITIRESRLTIRVALRMLNEIARQAMQDLGEYWHANFAPLHFTHRGATKYGYTPRQGESGSNYPGPFRRSYTGHKLKVTGNTLPMVFTGTTRDRILGKPNVKATASKGDARVRVLLDAPALNYRYKKSRINMRKEMTTVTDAENKQLAEVAMASVKRRLNALAASQTTAIG